VRGDYDVSSFRGEFDRVLKYVPNDLLKFRGVGGDMATLRSQIEMHMKSFEPCLGAANVDYIRHRLMRIDWSETQLHFVSGASGEVEQVINQMRFQFDVATDHRQRCSGVVRLSRLCCKRFQRGNHRSKWGA